MTAPLSDLLDISNLSYNNLNLIVKKSAEYVQKMNDAGRKISGVSYNCLPDKQPSKIRIIVKSSQDGKFTDEYASPKTFSQQLTVACFLFSVSTLANLGNSAFILCTNASGRGDLQMSISTKHCKSKLQERLIKILNDFVDEIKAENKIVLPENITDVQRDLMLQSTSGEISRRDVNMIMKNHGIDEVELYLELKDLKKNVEIEKSKVPTIKFSTFKIDDVIEKLRQNKITKKLEKDIAILTKKHDGLSEQKIKLEKEVDRMNKRNLWQRIFNK